MCLSPSYKAPVKTRKAKASPFKEGDRVTTIVDDSMGAELAKGKTVTVLTVDNRDDTLEVTGGWWVRMADVVLASAKATKPAKPEPVQVEYVTTRPTGKKQVRIAVEQSGFSVDIVAKDRDGNVIWYIAQVTPEGKMHLFSGIAKGNEEGLDVGKDGHIKLDK